MYIMIILTFLKIITGVLQGSILGPLLFLIYMNDIHKSSNLFHFILFADDTTLITKNDIYNTDIINAELAKLLIWFKVNKLSQKKKKCLPIQIHYLKTCIF